MGVYHIVFCLYGFWLPNDPRGSWSDYVGSKRILRFGYATKTETRISVAESAHNYSLRVAQKRGLQYPSVRLSKAQIEAVKLGFQIATEEGGYRVHACAVLPEHTHIVIEWETNRSVGRVVGHLKARATRSLLSEGLWMERKRSIWAEGYWKVFLNTQDDIRRSVEYVTRNVLK